MCGHSALAERRGWHNSLLLPIANPPLARRKENAQLLFAGCQDRTNALCVCVCARAVVYVCHGHECAWRKQGKEGPK